MIFRPVGGAGGVGGTNRRLGSHTVLPTVGAFGDEGTTATWVTPGSIVTLGKPSGSGTWPYTPSNCQLPARMYSAGWSAPVLGRRRYVPSLKNIVRSPLRT